MTLPRSQTAGKIVPAAGFMSRRAPQWPPMPAHTAPSILAPVRHETAAPRHCGCDFPDYDGVVMVPPVEAGNTGFPPSMPDIPARAKPFVAQ